LKQLNKKLDGEGLFSVLIIQRGSLLEVESHTQIR